MIQCWDNKCATAVNIPWFMSAALYRININVELFSNTNFLAGPNSNCCTWWDQWASDQCQCSRSCMTHLNSRAVLQNRQLLSNAHLLHAVLQGWKMPQYMTICMSSDFWLMSLDTKLAVLTNSMSCLITGLLTTMLSAFGWPSFYQFFFFSLWLTTLSLWFQTVIFFLHFKITGQFFDDFLCHFRELNFLKGTEGPKSLSHFVAGWKLCRSEVSFHRWGCQRWIHHLRPNAMSVLHAVS